MYAEIQGGLEHSDSIRYRVEIQCGMFGWDAYYSLIAVTRSCRDT